jgi:hypothetical protein
MPQLCYSPDEVYGEEVTGVNTFASEAILYAPLAFDIPKHPVPLRSQLHIPFELTSIEGNGI